jgi:hypothetical protein
MTELGLTALDPYNDIEKSGNARRQFIGRMIRKSNKIHFFISRRDL